MTMNRRVQKIQNRYLLSSRLTTHNQPIQEIRKDQDGATRRVQVVSLEEMNEAMPFCPFTGLDSMYLVVQRRPIQALPALIRWIMRAVYFYCEWAASGKGEQGYFSIEYQGIYTSKEEAYHAARADGYSVTELPLNATLPKETCQFRCHDFPTSEASRAYRFRQMEIVAMPSAVFNALDKKVSEVSRATR